MRRKALVWFWSEEISFNRTFILTDSFCHFMLFCGLFQVNYGEY